MPTILRFRNFRIMIFTDDHSPAHVHVLGPEGQAIFLLNCAAGPVELRQTSSLRLAQENAVADFLNQNLELLCKAWENIHDYATGA